MHSWNSNLKPSINTEGPGHMINTERGILGFSGCYMKEWQDGMAWWLCVCMDAYLCLHKCVGEAGRHCVRWGVKVRSPGGLTSLHQQRSEALSLSRYTSSLGNVVSLQNKHTLISSALTHRPWPSSARRDDNNADQKKTKKHWVQIWHVDICCKL